MLEDGEVDLPQGALIHLGADRHPLVLLVVAGEVLYAAGDPAALYALDVGAGDAGGQQRVLGERLEGPSGERRAHQSTPSVPTARARSWSGLGGQHLAEPADELGFHVDPPRPQGSDKERRPIRLSPRTPDGPSDTLRAGCLAARRWEIPHVGACGERRLLVESHGTDEALDLRLHLLIGCH